LSEPHRRVCENRSGPDKQDPPARLFGNDDAPPSMNHPLRDWLEYTGLSAAARLEPGIHAHPEGCLWPYKPREDNSSYPAYSNYSDRFDKLIHP
jgi:hypothetical protein